MKIYAVAAFYILEWGALSHGWSYLGVHGIWKIENPLFFTPL